MTNNFSKRALLLLVPLVGAMSVAPSFAQTQPQAPPARPAATQPAPAKPAVAPPAAAAAPSAPAAAAPTLPPGVTPPADYIIGPEDVLSLVFWREKDLSADAMVRPDGKISLPLINEVQAAGLTPEQLRQKL